MSGVLFALSVRRIGFMCTEARQKEFENVMFKQTLWSRLEFNFNKDGGHHRDTRSRYSRTYKHSSVKFSA